MVGAGRYYNKAHEGREDNETHIINKLGQDTQRIKHWQNEEHAENAC